VDAGVRRGPPIHGEKVTEFGIAFGHGYLETVGPSARHDKQVRNGFIRLEKRGARPEETTEKPPPEEFLARVMWHRDKRPFVREPVLRAEALRAIVFL
jgi:hypothetical protein